MVYYLKDGVFYCEDKEVLRLVRNDYFIYSTLRILDSNKEVLVKCRLHPWCSFKFMKIVKQNLKHWISIEKKNKLYYLITTIDDEKYNITVKTSNNLFSLKLKGDFIVNNEERGTVFGKMDDFFNSSYHFEFIEQNKELNFYCMIFFALRYYYIEDVA
ncbi:hypothetical protein [Myroides odoratus]|uniref:hypothetical protein n=1 Tax=Myroides odoratus TaxID=256 RepID=UPI0033413F7A